MKKCVEIANTGKILELAEDFHRFLFLNLTIGIQKILITENLMHGNSPLLMRMNGAANGRQ